MRWLLGFVFLMLALGTLRAMGCGAAEPEVVGNCGWDGTGGGAAFLAPGLWVGHVDDVEEGGARACFYVDGDCTSLAASADCNIGPNAPRAHLAEIDWTNGRNELDERCAAAIGVTPDLVDVVPIRDASFTIELTDAEGGDWWIHGNFTEGFAEVEARRTTDSGYCELPYSVRVAQLR